MWSLPFQKVSGGAEALAPGLRFTIHKAEGARVGHLAKSPSCSNSLRPYAFTIPGMKVKSPSRIPLTFTEWRECWDWEDFRGNTISPPHFSPKDTEAQGIAKAWLTI